MSGKSGRDWIGILLAVGICTALNVIVVAVLYDAIFSKGPGLSENATQILTGWGGGIIGILGAMVGYKAATDTNGTGNPPSSSSKPSPPPPDELYTPQAETPPPPPDEWPTDEYVRPELVDE